MRSRQIPFLCALIVMFLAALPGAAGAQAQRIEAFPAGIPPGYYDGMAGLNGAALQSGLHNIIDAHTVMTYASSWTSFKTTDDKPNGKVWDMYSDVPNGTPAYEFTFVVDQDKGTGGTVEGQFFNREHSWPNSWFGGNVSPMYSDLFLLYPTDKFVNHQRDNYPYGEVASPTWTSTNGSKLGPCSYPGYSGTVFEPIDGYKGDFARAYFYMATRYYGEDSGWPGSDMAIGSQLRTWAVNLLLEWNAQDPVSSKEIERNDTVYGFQNNRNPYIDHPEYAGRVFGSLAAAGDPEFAGFPRLLPAAPNPFAMSTALQFEVVGEQIGRLDVFDSRGRLVAVLFSGPFAPGIHTLTWNGRTFEGEDAAAGIYFAQLRAGGVTAVTKMVRIR